MFSYRPGDEVGELEPWPFDNPASAYRIVEARPRASGRLDTGGPGHTTRSGIWRCTPGAFECTEQGDELMTVLAGRCRITWLESGENLDLAPGDTLFIRNGSRVRWTIFDELTKVFFAHLAEGY